MNHPAPAALASLAEQPFVLISDLIRSHAQAAPERLALIEGPSRMSFGELDRSMDRIAARLQSQGLGLGDAIAICAQSSIDYARLFLGALRAGVVVAPLAPSSTPQSLDKMLADAQARIVFLDSASPRSPAQLPQFACVALDTATQGANCPSFADWLTGTSAADREPPLLPVDVGPDAPFNIIYSSGTTGEPKGIVQAHGMRWMHVNRSVVYGYGPDAVGLLSTPLYSNTTLVVFFPTLAWGGCVVLMRKFDALNYLELAQQHRVTHTMLVPVQYRRIMAVPDFGRFDLRSFRCKFCTSAPFAAELKADVLARWPGGLVEFYGMTEGGGTCILNAHENPDKLHTVGRPVEGHDIRLLGDDGREVGAGEAGEVVGHSAAMMKGYHRQPARTREAEWYDASGKRFIRTGDIGRFDADGFLILFDRKKDMIISGGFNVYPSDLEAVLRNHPAVYDCAVVGMPSEQWGETPVAFVVRRPGATDTAEAVRTWTNDQLGKTQRISELRWIAELPRSAIGKVLKRELRDANPASLHA